MRRILALAFFCSLTLTPIGIGVGAPITGSFSDEKSLNSAQVWQKTKTFRAGERACVLVIGDYKTAAANIEIYVFDRNNVLVASDKGSDALVGDFVCVIWYPPRDGEYRIEVRNPSAFAKTCYIAVK